MMNHLLGDLVNTDSKRMGKTGNNTTTRHHSTPIWPSELPDVFSFPDSFFELQKDLDYSVLEYLVRMGYAEAADSFNRELGFEEEEEEEEEEEGKKERDNSDDSDDNMNEACFTSKTLEVDMETANELLKQQQCKVGIDSVHDRKAIMQFILDGDIEGALSLVDNLWPAFFERRPLVKLRLLHLQAVEMLRDFFSQEEEPSDADQVAFFDYFVGFVGTHLAHPAIAASDSLTSAMEAMMGVLVRGKFACGEKEGDSNLPPEVAKVLDPALRRELAHGTNAALRGYCGGETGEGGDVVGLLGDRDDLSGGAGIGNNELSHENGRLVRLVQLFAATYAGSEGKLEKTAAITIK